MSSVEQFLCTICNNFVRSSFKAVFRHMSQHRCDPGLSIVCGIDSCTEVYTKYDSYRTHVYRKHREYVIGSSTSTLSETGSSSSNVHIGLHEGGHECESDDEVDDRVAGCDFESESIFPKRSSALFLLKTREERKVTQTALNGIVQDMRGFWREAMGSLQEKIMRMAHDKQPIDDVLQLVSAEPELPFDGLETQYSQHKYFKEHLSLVMPEEKVLGERQVDYDGKLTVIKDLCYYVPLLKSLKALLRTDVVREQVLNSHRAPDGVLGDYCDGELFASSSLFKEDPCALQIQLYYDELEICNPLGSKAKKHKLGLAYYSLGNLHPELRSALSSIQLLFVVNYSSIEKHGYNKVFEPIVDAVLELEKECGVTFKFDNGIEVTLRGTITTFSADNLAAWGVAGFKALGSAFRKCQYCMAVDEYLQTKFLESEFQLRTKEVYQAHCDALGGPHHQHIATTYGMWRDSELNRSKYFHVTNGFVPDIMHDILEGSLELCVRHILHHYVREAGLFSLDVLNDRIKSFSYGVDIRNKPTDIPVVGVDVRLKQSASQMWCLARVLPFLIGEFIPEDDHHWDNFLTLLTVMDFVFAPATTIDKANLVASLTQDFLADFKELYPERSLTPKMHYMIHMPSWMKWCGPLCRTWCMRYEAKHSFFKHLSNILGNYKNVLKTLSERHQHYMCYQQCVPSGYLRNHPVYCKGKPVSVSSLSYGNRLREVDPDMDGDCILHRVYSVEIRGTRYSKNAVIVIHIDEDDVPLFGVILEFLVTPLQEIFFVCKMLVTEAYSRHFHSYEVLLTDFIQVLYHRDLYDFHPLECITLFGSTEKFVMLKYHLFHVSSSV